MTKRTINSRFDQSFDEQFNTIEKQIGSTFRWAKFMGLAWALFIGAMGCGVLFLLYAAAQWLLANK